MSPFIVLATQTEGTVLCHDWMYEWRMFFVDDLISMGAKIFIADPHRVIVSGKTPLMSDRLFCKILEPESRSFWRPSVRKAGAR